MNTVGDVYDLLQDDKQHQARAKQVDDMADALVSLCETAVDDMAQAALDQYDEGFAEEVNLHEEAFIEKLAKTALNAALGRLKVKKESY